MRARSAGSSERTSLSLPPASKTTWYSASSVTQYFYTASSRLWVSLLTG